MKLLFVPLPLFLFLGCQLTNSDINKCIDSQLKNYDTLQKDLSNPNRFEDEYCKVGVCITRDQIKSNCFLEPYSNTKD